MAQKKAAAKKQPYKKAVQISAEELKLKRNKEIAAIILLVAGVLAFFLAVIKGESGWFTAHNAVIGFFGLCSFIFPIVLIFIAVLLSYDKFEKSVTPKIVETVLLLFFLSSCIYVFKTYNNEPIDRYANALIGEYKACDALGGGMLGAVLGFPLGALLGPTGAKILSIIATLTDLMIITGTTVSRLFVPAKKLTEKTKEEINNRHLQKDEYVPRQREDGSDDNVYKPDFGMDIEDPKPDVLSGKKTVKPHKTKKTKDETFPKEPATVDEQTQAINEIFKTPTDRENEAKAEKAKNNNDKNAVQKEIDAAAAAALATSQSGDGSYRLPSTVLLNVNKKTSAGFDPTYEMQQNSEILVDTLDSFGVNAQIVGVTRGPSVTRYDVKPAVGVRINKITNLADDIALSLATSGIRIAPIPNKSAIGIEVPNKNKNTVGLRELLESPKFNDARSKKLTVALGENIAGEPQYADLAKMPHLLIAGTTGSGKSVCLNSMIISILFNACPDEVKFIMIDPKGVELSVYNGIPHMLIDVVKNPHKAAGALAWAVQEMMKRYARFEEIKVRDIKSYNKAAAKDESIAPMSQVVIVIDELADLMMVSPSEVEDSICRLAQMARAAGMHLVIATQSPRADVITGLIKANIPSRIALKVSNGLDSRIILDQNGAEKLLGNGDMLFNPVGANKPTRIQGCFVSDPEIEKIVTFVKKQETSQSDEEIEREISALATQEKSKKVQDIAPSSDEDELIPKAVEIILETGTASTSFIQRRLKVGYARGARILDELEEMGIVSAGEGSKPRKILITKEQWIERNAMSPDDQLAFNDNTYDDGGEE